MNRYLKTGSLSVSIFSFCFVLYLIFGVYLFSNAQDTFRSLKEERREIRAARKYGINLNLTQLAVVEFRVGFERYFKKRNAITLELAYKPDRGNNSTTTYNNGTDDQPYMVATSYTIGASHKYFFAKTTGRTVSIFIET